MAWGFRKSMKLAPGVRLNLSRRGVGVSGGPRGAKMSANTRGQRHRSFSFFGLFSRKRI